MYWKHTIEQCSNWSVGIYLKGKHKKHWKDEIPATLFFFLGGDATRLANLSAPLQNSSQKGMQAYKTSHTGKRSWWKQHTVAPVPPSSSSPPPPYSMTKWFSQLWCRPPLTYNASLG